MSGFDGCEDFDVLAQEQARIGAMMPEPWRAGPDPLLVAGLFIAFARGEQGPGRAGDTAVVGAVLTSGVTHVESVHVSGQATAPYSPGLLAAREGALLLRALSALLETGVEPDVVLVDATGRDHRRRAGLAVHLGQVAELPTVGVTHRPLRATGMDPAPEAGSSSDLVLDGEVVGRWVRTQTGVKPLAVHAGWRTDPATATEVVLRATGSARTPEPLRLARMVAREARAAWMD